MLKNFFKKIFKDDNDSKKSFEIPELKNTDISIKKQPIDVSKNDNGKPDPFVSPLFGKDKNVDTSKVFVTKVDENYTKRSKTLTHSNVLDEDKYKGFVMGDSDYYLNQLDNRESRNTNNNKAKVSSNKIDQIVVKNDDSQNSNGDDYPEDYFEAEDTLFNLDDLHLDETENNPTSGTKLSVDSDTNEVNNVKAEIKSFDYDTKVKETRTVRRKERKYVLPNINLLKKVDQSSKTDLGYLEEQEMIINRTLEEFGIAGHVVNFTNGPTVTQYEISLDAGVKVNRVTGIEDNLKMNLASASIRIEAPIPGKSTIGVEVPNTIRRTVFFGNIFSKDFIKESKPLEVVLGVNNAGEIITGDIAKMPHGLIAGSTGSGKSVCLDTILVSLLMKNSPDDLKLILIDPKVVGLANYKNIPHLITPIIQEPSIASEALKWVLEEMERRYQLLYNVNAKDIKSYNRKISIKPEFSDMQKLPYLIVVIEEMADLMATSGADVEASIMRITAKARACGIHLLVATQRPSVDVIKGTIKSNISTRIAMRVASMSDSMTILDATGAEKLLGNGDMLFNYNGMGSTRVQGAFVTDEEIEDICDYIRTYEPHFVITPESLVANKEIASKAEALDPYFLDVARYVIENNYASINNVQKQFGVGFNRASAIFEQLEQEGIITPKNSKNPRKVIMKIEEFDNRYEREL